MLSIVTGALAFHGPNSALLASGKRAPAVSMMTNSMEYDFVYGSSAGQAAPMGYGKSDSAVDFHKPSGPTFNSQFTDFVYGSSGANATPLARDSHASALGAGSPMPIRSLEQEFVYGNVKPLGDGKGNWPNAPVAALMPAGTPMTIASLEHQFVYASAGGNAAPLGDGRGN